MTSCPPIPKDAQRVGSHDFRWRRGDTPVMGIRLWGQDPLSGEIVSLPAERTIVSWSVDWPAGEEIKTTEPGGGLITDPDTGFIAYPITQTNLDDLDAQGSPIATRVKLVADDGFAITYLEGTVALYGDA